MPLRLERSTRTALMAAAREWRLPACELAERLIRGGLERGAVPALAEAMRVALEEHERRSVDCLAKLLVRNLIGSDTTRRLLFSHMPKQWGGARAAQSAPVDLCRL